MGNKKSKEIPRGELTEDALKLIDEIFQEIDKDGSKTIDKDEAIKYWGK